MIRHGWFGLTARRARSGPGCVPG